MQIRIDKENLKAIKGLSKEYRAPSGKRRSIAFIANCLIASALGETRYEVPINIGKPPRCQHD